MTPDDKNKVVTKIFLTYQLYVGATIAPLVYLAMLLMDYQGERALRVASVLLPPIGLVSGVVGPYLSTRLIIESALRLQPGDRPGDRLARILRAPSRIEVAINTISVLGAGLYVALPAIYYETSLWVAPWFMLMLLLLSMLTMLQIRLGIERLLKPFALEEFHRHTGAVLQGGGFSWPRQRWYLPYAFGLFVCCTLAVTATVIVKQASKAYETLRAQVGTSTAEQFMTLLDQTVSKLLVDSVTPLCFLGAFLLISAALSAWQLARHQSEGARGVQEAIEALASGSPRLPDWVSTDEVGDLSRATARAFEQLKDFSLSLAESAQELRRSAEQVSTSTNRQMEVITQQASALQETQVTTQEIKQTSNITAQKAGDVLRQTEQVDAISRTGQAAIEKSLQGIQEIGDQVREMARRIRELDDRTQQIANITSAVKDLADQSNMLALNAAIEAVRSGEHGKGFGVVAREIRSLADQSIEATQRVREILQDISGAIRSTVDMTEKGSGRIESSLAQVREFGAQIQQLTSIAQQNAAAVRQITAAVNQQDTGIVQIVQAVADLSRLMDQTMAQIQSSTEALNVVNAVADRVGSFVKNYATLQNKGSTQAVRS